MLKEKTNKNKTKCKLKKWETPPVYQYHKNEKEVRKEEYNEFPLKKNGKEREKFTRSFIECEVKRGGIMRVNK